jgi:hypothetical protein
MGFPAAQRNVLRFALVVTASLLVPSIGSAQEGQSTSQDHSHHHHGQQAQGDLGYHGHGHDRWHESFYKQLQIPGSKTSCCNLADCRPTQIRSNGDHYEIMKDGRWIRVDINKIVKVTAPDGGAHICAPDTTNIRFDPDYVFCIVMPLET